MGLFNVSSGAPDYGDLEPGVYPGLLAGVRATTITWEQGDSEVFEWSADLDTDNPDEPLRITGLTSQIVSPKSRAFAYLVSLLGAGAVQVGAKFDETDVIGKRCLFAIDFNKKGYLTIANILPAPRGAARGSGGGVGAAAPPAPEPAAPAAPVSPLRAEAPGGTIEIAKPAGRAKPATVRAAVGEPDDDLPF